MYHACLFCVPSTILSLPKCGKGKPALVRRNTVDDKSELIACIETGNFAKAARIAAGKKTAVNVSDLYACARVALCLQTTCLSHHF